ncbi:MAG: threonine/serine exporter family protein [Propionibacterium sp.]|nr:threonine/serine exporter family protein [Propionibacterium sp.]
MASDHGHGSGPGPIDDAIFRPNQKPRQNHPTNSAGSSSTGSNSGGPDSPGPLDDEPTAVEMTLRPEELTAIEASTTWSVPAMTTTSPTINQPSPTLQPAKPPPRARRIFGLPLDRYLRDTKPLPLASDLQSAEDDMEARQARLVVDLVERVTSMAISVGASASEAVAMALRLAATFGITIHVDVTNTSVIVTQHRSMDDDPITSLRVVRGRTSDYQRLGRLQKLVDQICNGEVDLEDARSHLETLVAAPRLYRPWFVTLNMGLMGGGISWLFSGSIWDVLLAFFTTCLVDMAVQAMGRRHVTSFFTQAVGGAVPTVMALLVMILQWKANMSLPLSPSLVVAAGMISLLAGTSMVSAAQDAIDGYVVTSSGRFVDVFVQTGGIILGVMGVLWIGLKVGTPSYINPTVWVSGPIITQMLAAAIVSWSFGVSCHAGLRVLVTCAFLGAIGWGGYVLGAALGMSAPAASGVGAFLVGMAATAASRRWDFPQVGLVTCGVVTLMPGMMIYRGLYMILGSQLDQPSAAGGGTVLMQALLVGIAIAIGSSLGALTVRPLIVPLDHASRLATFRSWGMGATVPRERTSSRGIRKRWRSLKERKAAGTS